MHPQTSAPSDPWAAIDALIAYEKEPTGPEWFTVAQFAERYGMSIGGAAAKLRRLAGDGKLREWAGIGLESRRRIRKYTKA